MTFPGFSWPYEPWRKCMSATWFLGKGPFCRMTAFSFNCTSICWDVHVQVPAINTLFNNTVITRLKTRQEFWLSKLGSKDRVHIWLISELNRQSICTPPFHAPEATLAKMVYGSVLCHPLLTFPLVIATRLSVYNIQKLKYLLCH